MATFTYASLLTNARILSDTVNETTRFSDATLGVYAQYAWRELYSMLVDYNFISTVTTSITATGASSYNLPEFFRLIAIESQEGNVWRPIQPLHVMETSIASQNLANPTLLGSNVVGYTLTHDLINVPKLHLWPESVTGTFRARTIPDAPVLSADNSWRLPNRWDELISLRMALYCLSQNERNNEQVLQLYNMALERFKREVAAIDAFNPLRPPRISYMGGGVTL